MAMAAQGLNWRFSIFTGVILAVVQLGDNRGLCGVRGLSNTNACCVQGVSGRLSEGLSAAVHASASSWSLRTECENSSVGILIESLIIYYIISVA